MNKIIGALVLAVVIVVLLYAGFTKVMTLFAENETLKQNVITLTQTNEQNLKAIADMKELSDKVDSLTLQLKHMTAIQLVEMLGECNTLTIRHLQKLTPPKRGL